MKNIIKRVIVGVCIALVLSFINACEVQAATLSYTPDKIEFNGSNQSIYFDSPSKLYGANFTLPNSVQESRFFFTYPYIQGSNGYIDGTIKFKMGVPPIILKEQTSYNIITYNQTHYLASNWNCTNILTDQNGNKYCTGWWNAQGNASAGGGQIGSTNWTDYKYYTIQEHIANSSETISNNFYNYIFVYIDTGSNQFSCIPTNFIEGNTYIDVECPNVNINENERFIIKIFLKGHYSTPQLSSQFVGLSFVQFVSNSLQDVNSSIQETHNFLTDTSTPSNSDYDFDNYNEDNGVITNLLTMPITLLQGIINGMGNSCSAYNLGTVKGQNITLPCINVGSHLGSVWTIIDIIISGVFIFIFGKKCIKIFNDVTNLRSNQVDEVFK